MTESSYRNAQARQPTLGRRYAAEDRPPRACPWQHAVGGDPRGDWRSHGEGAPRGPPLRSLEGRDRDDQGGSGRSLGAHGKPVPTSPGVPTEGPAVILVDAGPMVALLSARDQHHDRCVGTLTGIRQPLATVWPALAEAMYLLAPWPDAQDVLWQKVIGGAIRILPLGEADCPRMRQLMRKYRDLPMDLADAASFAPPNASGSSRCSPRTDRISGFIGRRDAAASRSCPE